ncbi:MAG: histidine kinase [Anaerolineae bacterium]
MNNSSTAKHPTPTYREWAIFGLRWIIPLGMVLFALLDGTTDYPTALATLVVIAAVSAITNLLFVILLLYDRWQPLFTLLALLVDAVLLTGAVFLGGSVFIWLLAVPLTVAGITYKNWLVGLLSGVAASGVMAAAWLLLPAPLGFSIGQTVFGLLAFPLAGALIALLSNDTATIRELQNQVKLRGERAQQVSRLANEYMRVVYEMAEVLSTSRLDPRRVLASAVDMSVEGLGRVGVAPPLYVSILLFAETLDGVMLRLTQHSSAVYPSDRMVVITGVGGAIGRALTTLESVVSRVPQEDPELRLFESYRMCKTVLCLPLQSGRESYGVMLIGSQEEDAFKEMHIELMRAVANQTAAALHNARLYISLLEQRDRIVEVEKTARAQLADDLHDGPTQSVAAITMRLNFIRRLIEKKPEQALAELYNIEDMARRATKEIRQLLFELRPRALDNSFEDGLRQLASKVLETYDQQVEVVIDPACEPLLDPQTAQTLFSIVIEAVNNARKHSGADCVTVSAFVRDGVFVLDITDNGRGFDVEKALAEARNRAGHMGLLSLQERAALVEGQMEIRSSPDEGASVIVYIPLEVLQRRREEKERRMSPDTPELITHQGGRIQ